MNLHSAFLLGCCWLVIGCSDGGDANLTVDGVIPPAEDTVSGEDQAVNPPPDAAKANTLTEWVPGDHGQIFSKALVPVDCTKEAPCPALVLVPDGLEGAGQFDCCAKTMAEVLHTIIITYNPPGRGVSGEVSEGEEDYGGSVGQDALKDVANHWEKKSVINGSNFGILSIGYGVGTAAATLARFQSTALAFVGYFIDVEGPPNRCYVTMSPYHVDEEGWYINEDGPGVSTTRCDFDLNLRKVKFPAGTSSDGKGTNGTPNSYICNPNAFVLRQSGMSCDDDKWWQEREASTWLEKIEVHYLRIQFLHDHKQPTRYNAREALYWVSQSEAPTYQLNTLNTNNSTKGYSDQQLVDAGVYNVSSSGNGYGTDVFDDNGDFKKVSQSKLYGSVLPKFVKMMQKRAAE